MKPIKYYYLDLGDAEPLCYSTFPDDEEDRGWIALSGHMWGILESWLEVAANDGAINELIFHEKDIERCNWDQPGGADGIELPYELELPATGILEALNIRIWQWPDPGACQGHESLALEHMGETQHCDGTCVIPGTVPE